MQTVSSHHPNNVNQQTRKIAILAILLFAFSGLISGFAVGAFVHSKAQPGSETGRSSNTGSKSTPITQVTHLPVPTIHPLRMGDPVVTEMSTFQKANASTPYIFSAHAVDTAIDKHHGKQIYASGITCKLWLQHIPQGNFVDLSIKRLQKMDIQDPLTGDEIPGALIFAPGVSQIQMTNSNGEVSWNYTLATSVKPGTYYLVVLMDWQGQYSNWSWRYVSISK
jgi:hypothetical protein